MTRPLQTESEPRGPSEERTHADPTAELCFKVAQMIDGNSVKAITREVRRLAGISGVQIDLHTGWVVITGQRIDSEAIRQAIRNAGYEAQL